MKEKEGKWITIKGRHIFIEDGQSLEDVFKEREEAGKLLGVKLPPIKSQSPKIKKVSILLRNNRLPKNIKGEEYLGGTMDENGNPVDMNKFKNGYLVSCGNDSFPENKEFLLSEEGEKFIQKFIDKYSVDGELYIGSWFENNKNNNEPTIWIKDKEKAIKLAKLLGQYSITDCAKYNQYGCKNYKLLNDEQWDKAKEIFINVCNEKEHKINLREVKL